MFDLAIPVAGGGASLGLPRVAAELHRSAQRLRVFVMRPPPRGVPARAIMDLVTWPREQVRARLEGGFFSAAGRSSSVS
jgi:hypothetical protein